MNNRVGRVLSGSHLLTYCLVLVSLYFFQILTVLLKHKCGPTTRFLNEAGLELFRKMVGHLGNFSVMQVARLLLLPKHAALQGAPDDPAEQSRCYEYIYIYILLCSVIPVKRPTEVYSMPCACESDYYASVPVSHK